jgi:serine/threonine kinase 32
VTYKKNQKLYAMKEMSKAKIIEKKSYKAVRYEKELLTKLKHPLINSYLDLLLT